MDKIKKGSFFVIDGINGSGKSTLIKNIMHPLMEMLFKHTGQLLHTIQDPGTTCMGVQLRELVKYGIRNDNTLEFEHCTDNSELLLFNAARSQMIEHVIKPKLESGISLISDRFNLSTIAYQGYGNNMLRACNTLDDLVTTYKPDITFILDIDPSEAYGRISNVENEQPADVMESKGESYISKVRKGYLELAFLHPNVYVIDASISEKAVLKLVLDKIEYYLECKYHS